MERSLNICHLLTSVEVGGAERVVLDLARSQQAAGHRVSVLTLTGADGAMAHEFRGAGLPLAAMPKLGPVTDPTLPVRLARKLRAQKTDVIHTHNELPLIYGAVAGRLARAGVVHSKHGTVAVRGRQHLVRRAAALAVDVFVAVSEATAEVARTRGECSPDKLRVIVNGTDLSRFPAPAGAREAIRGELGIPSDARVIITVGRLVPEKNHALLLRAAAPLLGARARSQPECHLVIVGGGPLVDALRVQAGDSPYVHLAGPRRDVPALLAAADAFVMSSDTEGLPIGLIEAWAAGLPVASTAVGGIPAAVTHDDNGLLVPPGDEEALREAIRRVLEPSEATRAMAERGRRHAERVYSAEAMANAYFELYRGTLRR